MVKEKPNSIRTYDEEGFRKRAACLCFKNKAEQEVLLVSSSGKDGRWVVPGGGIEPSEDTGAAAAREAYEEAGVRGELGRYLGKFENRDRKHRTSVYILTVTDILEDWDDAKITGRKRKWFPIDEAKVELRNFKPIQCQYFDLIDSCTSESGS